MTTTTFRRLPRGLLAAALLGIFAVTGAAVAQPQGKGGHGRMFERMDTDGDGAVSRAEAAAFRAAHAAEADADNDGFVTFEEMRAWREARREQRARDRFARMDTDGDGRVSVQEIAAAGERRFDRMDRNDDGVLDADDRRGRRHGADGRPGRRGTPNEG